VLGYSMRYVIEHVQSSDFLLFQKVYRMRLSLLKKCRQDITCVDFLLARRLGLQGCSLDHALERRSAFRALFASFVQLLHFGREKSFQLTSEVLDVSTAVAYHPGPCWVAQQGQKQMLESQMLVPAIDRIPDREIQRRL